MARVRTVSRYTAKNAQQVWRHFATTYYNKPILSLFSTWRLYSRDAKRKQESGHVIG